MLDFPLGKSAKLPTNPGITNSNHISNSCSILNSKIYPIIVVLSYIMANLRYPAKKSILSWLVDNPIDTKRLKD